MLPNDKIGTNGRYVIDSVLHSGSMGSTYTARDSFHGYVVIKELNIDPQMLGHDLSPKDVEDFENEGRRLLYLKHDNIVSAYDYFEEFGKHYLVMEYITGTDMDTYVRSLRQQNPPVYVPESDVILCARDLFSALHYIHEKRIVHRDVKPGNMMRKSEPNGTIKHVVIDFGIARGTDTPHTVALGTPGYVDRNQIDNRANDKSDVFGAGATILYVITGLDSPIHLNGAPDFPMFYARIDQIDQLRSGLRCDWPDFLRKATDCDEHKRYSAGDLLQELDKMTKQPAIIIRKRAPQSAPQTQIIQAQPSNIAAQQQAVPVQQAPAKAVPVKQPKPAVIRQPRKTVIPQQPRKAKASSKSTPRLGVGGCLLYGALILSGTLAFLKGSGYLEQKFDYTGYSEPAIHASETPKEEMHYAKVSINDERGIYGQVETEYKNAGRPLFHDENTRIANDLVEKINKIRANKGKPPIIPEKLSEGEAFVVPDNKREFDINGDGIVGNRYVSDDTKKIIQEIEDVLDR